jgi:ADP-heptose:LPS heptosyltransferase
MSVISLSSPSSSSGSPEAAVLPPVKILVLQLARIGDTLQSLMALRAAKQLYPQLEIHIVARKKFSGAARQCAWIHQVHELPTEEIVGPILDFMRTHRVEAHQIDFRTTLGPLATWISPLVDEPWPILLNWTYSDASAWLAGIIPAIAKYGYIRREDQSAAAPDGWSHFVQAVVQQKTPQNIHLTDILTTQLLTALQLHVGDPAQEAGARESMSARFFNLPKSSLEAIREEGRPWKDPSRKWISFQLGAAHAAKTWTPENWGQLAVRLLSRHPDSNLILLGGGEQDRAVASDILDALKANGLEEGHVLSLIDQTDFTTWASVVMRSQWVFSGDTSVVHLASVLGTRVINLSIGPVRHQETGPYGNGHFVIQPDITCAACGGHAPSTEHACRSAITPDLAYAVWSYGASEWAHRREISFEDHLVQIGMSGMDAGTRVYRSRIRLTDEGGGVSYELIQKNRSVRFEDWSAAVNGHIARAWYCGWTPQLTQEFDRSRLSAELLRDLRKVSESVEVLQKICEEARRTAQQIQREASRTKSQKVMRVEDKSKLQELALKLSEIEKLLERLVKAQPCLSLFLATSRVMTHNLRGNEVEDLGRQTAQSWDQLLTGARIWKEWISHTLNITRPRAVRPADSSRKPELTLN